jgi:hypothetical protein
MPQRSDVTGKILEREALIKHHRQQWLEGLPKEESRSETTSEEEGDDDDDDDAGSRYDTATTLAHLLDVRSLQEPVGEGSTSQASRAALAPIEGEEEQEERRAREGPLERGSAEPIVLLLTSVAPRPRTRSPRTSLAGSSATPMPETRAPSSGMRTQGQMASMAKKTPMASSATAPRSPGPTKGSVEGLSQKPSSGSGKSGAKPLISMSG